MADSAANTAATPTPPGASREGAELVWVSCRLRAGHGVASIRDVRHVDERVHTLRQEWLAVR